MAAGNWAKGIVLILASLLIFGFSSSTLVHETIWENSRDFMDMLPGSEGGGGGEGTGYYVYPEYVRYDVSWTLNLIPAPGTEYKFTYRTGIPNNAHPYIQEVITQGMSIDPDVPVTGKPDSFNPYPDPDPLDWMVLETVSNIDHDVEIKLDHYFESRLKIWDEKPEDCGVLGDIDDTYHSDRLADQTWEVWDRDDESYVEVGIENTVKVQDIANLIRSSGEDNVLVLLHDAYTWVVENIDYHTVENGRLKSVTETIEDENGDCDDMSTLLISIARAMGIPAWMEMGYIFDGHSWIGHAWVRAFVPLIYGDHTVIAIDPANKQFALSAPNRLLVLSDYEADANRMEEYYQFLGVIHNVGGNVEYTFAFEMQSFTESPERVNVPANHSTW